MPYKVYIVGHDSLIAKMYSDAGYEIVPDIAGADIVQFTGGSDVSPEFYGHPKHPTTGSNLDRDIRERDVWERVAQTRQIKVGICRGAQFLCVMNGGMLWQDVSGHALAGTHVITYIDENNLVHSKNVTSTHHQMMYPAGPHCLWGAAYLSSHRDFGGELRKKTNFNSDGPDVEIVFWPGSLSLGFQPHPEYGVRECRDLFFDCLYRAFEYRSNDDDDAPRIIIDELNQ
jgi:gamma-glutamyl-gamma-aminobutyrate hydrolase PuuD